MLNRFVHHLVKSPASSQLVTRYLSTTMPSSSVAVILAGNGVYDGSEVHEASAVMINLHRNNAEYSVYAPDIPQMHVINHTNGEEMTETRNVLVESARIARGKISPLSKLNAADHSAVILPGGFGAAKNLSNFAVKNAEMEVIPELEQALRAFHAAKKPIGLCCIAPVIAARLFKGEVTMGGETEEDGKWPYAGATGAVAAMGATHIAKSVHEVHIDTENRIVTTPAFMCETKLHEIHDGVGAMVKAVLELAE